MTPLKKLNLLSLACLIYGGFLLLTYAAFAYQAIWQQEFLPVLPVGRRGGGLFTPVALLYSPLGILWLASGILFVFTGLVLFRHVRKSESTQTKDLVLNTLLTEEERSVVKILREKDAITQKELASTLGFSAVKTHRILSRLQGKKLVKTHPFGMTNKVILTPP